MTGAEKRAVRLWQEAICKLWSGRCGLRLDGCLGLGSAGHHIIGRSFKDAKFCILNGIYVCTNCHQWADDHPDDLLLILKKKYYSLYEWHMVNKPLLTQTVTWHPESYYQEQVEQLQNLIKQAP